MPNDFLDLDSVALPTVEVGANAFLDLPTKARERFPTTSDAQKALTLEGELGLSTFKKSTVPIIADLVKDVKQPYNDAVRRYYETGESPWMAQLIPGMSLDSSITPGSYDQRGQLVGPSIKSPLGPEPPGGYDKQGKPLDENGKRYVVPSMSSEVGKAVSAVSRGLYTKATAVADVIGTKVGDISDDLFKAYDNLTKTNPNMANAIKGEAIALETIMGTGSGLAKALLHPVHKWHQKALGRSEEEANVIADELTNVGNYVPYTEEGKILTESIMKVIGATFEYIGAPLAKVSRKIYQPLVTDVIKSVGGDPEIAGQFLEDALTFVFGAKAIGTGAKVLKTATDAFSAKRVEGSLGYTPSVVTPKVPYTGTSFKPLIPPLVTSGEVKTGLAPEEFLTLPEIKGTEIKSVDVKPEVVKDLLQVMVEKAQSKIDEINKTQADLEAAKKAVAETPVENVIAEELKIKGEKIQKIRDGKVDESDQKLMDLKTPEFYQSEAERLGITFNGIQEGIGKSIPTFTDPLTKSSFLVDKGQSIEGKLKEVQDRFNIEEPKESVNDEDFSEVNALDEATNGEGLDTLKINETRVEPTAVDEVVKPKRKIVKKKKEQVTIDSPVKGVQFRGGVVTEPQAGIVIEAIDPKGKVIGKAEAGEYWPGVYSPDGIQVDAAFQRKGIASALYDAMQKFAPKGSTIDFRNADILTEEGKLFKDAYDKKRGYSGDVFTHEMTATDYVPSQRDSIIVGKKKAKVVTELDEQLGEPTPESLRPSNSNHPFRDSNPEYTNTMSKMFAEKISKPDATPEMFTRYLINEVNRWLNGEEVPIDQVRDGLSQLSSRSQDVITKFDSLTSFEQWKGTVGEAAKWARGTDRQPKMSRGIEVYTGSDEPFTKFDLSKIGKRTDAGFAGRGAYTTLDVEKAGRWGKHIMKTTIPPNTKFLNITQQSELYEKYGMRRLTKEENALPKEQQQEVYAKVVNEFSDRIKEQGYEGVKWKMSNGDTQYVLFKPESYDFTPVDPLKINGTGETRLNMMIPVDQLPQMVKDVMKGIKVAGVKFGELYRNKEVFDKTGYWLGKDGKWRYEIDSSKFLISPKLAEGESIRLPEAIKFLGKTTILDAVPELNGVTLRINHKMKAEGHYLSDQKAIEVRSIDKATITHELQHAVNDIVGSKFKGTNPEYQEKSMVMNLANQLLSKAKSDTLREEAAQILIEANQNRVPWPFDIESRLRNTRHEGTDITLLDNTLNKYLSESGTDRYMKDPGEMEARLANKRMEMTEAERKTEPPWETLDKMLGDEEFVKTPDYAGKYGELDNLRKTASKVGSTLYMGIDPTQIPEATRKIIEGAKKLAAYTNQARGMKEWKPAAAAKMLREEFNRSFVDRSGNIRQKLLSELGNQGYEIIQKMYLSKGASSLAAQQLKQMRGEVYDGLNRTERRVLDNIILADRMLDIGKYKTAKEFKFPEGLSPIEAAAYNELFQFTEKLTGEHASLLRDRAKAYFDWMKKPLKDMLDAELISEQEFNDLASHNYRRLKLVDVFDKRSVTKTGKTKRTVYDSGVEALSRGRDTDIFEPSSEVMALEVFNRAYGRILNNAANRTLLDLARQDKTNPFVRVKETPKDGIPTGWDRVFVYEKGERKALYLSPEMSKEWITNSPEMSYKMSQFLRYASGSPVLRTFATGINWGFALANLPRDIMHIWYAARTFQDGKWNPVYSSNLPVYGMQIGRDLGSVFSDAVLRKGRYQDYIKEGGGMEFLVHQGRLMQRGRHIEGGLDKVMDFLGYFGETSEIMTRLAIRERVLRNGKSSQEATFAARDYMDFGQGGGLGKALDNAFPYLNASIQGTRGLFRAFKDNPLQSTYKTAQFAALVTGLYIYNNSRNPETMKSLKGNIDMQNNLVIPLGDGFSYLDEKGQTRYPYIKIPLDPGQRFFKTFFEASTDKWLGNQIDVDAVTNTLSQISPVGISSLPPTVSGALGYMYNKDFWKNEDIWKKTDKPFSWPQSKQEFIPGQTPQAMVDLGSATGLSPERTKHAIEQLITSGSEWAWLSGYGYDKVFSDLPKSQKEQHLAEALTKVPGIKRFIGVTNPYTQFASPIEKAREDSSLQRWQENRGLDALVDGYLYQKNTKREEINSYIKGFKDPDTQDRLLSRFEFSQSIKDLPNRSFWLALKGTPDTEARARLYVERLNGSTPTQQQVLRKELTIIDAAGGVVSDSFLDEVAKLRNKPINN